ncbi:MAG: MBL fold metallo-hydrolase [Nitrososphaerota archaeon]|nr:MBL fold metallo-hydrolase [Nitrososphaerales archaeon]MDW8045429.1 MBL fold metallo-hydrolase [Nitrososphaerota archaeon]
MEYSTIVTLYGAVGRIGGNIVLIEYKDRPIIIDFGKDFKQYRKYFEFPSPLPTRSITRELIKTEIVPQIRDSKGNILPLYEKFEDGRLIEEEGESPVKDVFISHAHMDHSGFLTLLRKQIKIHMGGMANLIYSTMMMTKREVTLESKLYWDECGKGERIARLKIEPFHRGSKIDIDGIQIIPYPVDHSVPGAYGFIVQTPDKKIGYTGDFRMHGPAHTLTEDFKEALSKEPLDLLICEGTNMGIGRVESEERVEKDAYKLIETSFKSGNRLVIVEVRSSDIDRIITFAQIAKELDSKIAVTPRMGYLLYQIQRSGLDRRLLRSIPSLYKDVKVLMKSKARLEWWEKDLLEDQRIETIDHTELKSPSSKTIVLDSGRFNVFEVTPPPGTLYIQSISEHIDEEEEFGEERFINAMALYGIIVYRLHSSGHVEPIDLINFINEVKPKRLIPIHTEHPEAFSEIFKGKMEVLLVEKGYHIKL